MATNEAKAKAGKARAEKQNMGNSRRNVAICKAADNRVTVQSLAMQYGMSRSGVQAILAKGTSYWEQYEKRAIDTGILSDDDVSEEVIQMIPVWDIEPNPWQPRGEDLDEDTLTTLQEDIYRNGLLSPILVRSNSESGKPELVYGQRRLEAFRSWDVAEWEPDPSSDLADESGYGWAALYHDGETTRIPAIVRFMSPIEVILASLAENAVRDDLSWLEETRALKRALDADDDLTQRRLASMMNMSPTNLSTRLSMLSLPDDILSWIDEGKLPWTTARDLLAFRQRNHIHQEELDLVVRYLSPYRFDASRPIDRGNLEYAMSRAMSHYAHRWEHLTPVVGTRHWKGKISMTPSGIDGLESSIVKHPPAFDIAEFQNEHFDYLHKLPTDITGETATWTCRADEWREAQKAAIAEIKEIDEALASTADAPPVEDDDEQVAQTQEFAFADIPEDAPDLYIVPNGNAMSEAPEPGEEQPEDVDDIWGGDMGHVLQNHMGEVLASATAFFDVIPNRKPSIEELAEIAQALERAHDTLQPFLQHRFDF